MALAVALTSAGLLASGWQGSASARTAASPPSSAPGVCSTNARGQVTNCPKPVPAAQLPAGVRDQRTLTSLPANLATLVDTRTWTSSGGNTYPGAQAPFGMIQWSPDTSPDRADGGGYTYSDNRLMGYSLTHVSGSGCKAAGDFPILPLTGKLPPGNPNAVTTAFTHSGEVAQAGFYKARNNMPQTITSSFSATPHAAVGKFVFPKTASADLLIKLRDSQETDFASHVWIESKTELAGSETSGGFCNESSKVGPQKYTIYFDISFSQPFTAKVITEPGQRDPNSVLLTFNTKKDAVVEAKAGISYVSRQNAQLNWQTEVGTLDLSSVIASAQDSWDSLLGEIAVSGGSYSEEQEFYSLLYKDFLQPNIVSDVNGQYFGSDWHVHKVVAGQSDQYSMFSGWDVYHSLSQLQAMLDPTAASDMAQSLVNYYGQNKVLPQWGYLNLDNYAQVGDPADAIIADYYAFGATGFDTASALSDMLAQATTVNKIRPGEALEKQYGFLPQNAKYGCCDTHDYTSSLLEYDTADLALSQFARELGDTTAAVMLQNRANNWKNVFDHKNNLLTPRNGTGQFVAGVTPLTTYRYLEGDAYQYLWDVPNNYAGLFGLLGGKAKVGPMLRAYLSSPNGRGTHPYLADEFDLGEQFAPDYADYPSETQFAVNNIRRNLYLPGPYGLHNNDDLGAESSQFIWEMLGMYPENPGSGNLVLASPGFPSIVISLPYGATITIKAPGASGTKFYVKSLAVNGVYDQKLYVPFSELDGGATMNWTLSSQPAGWGNKPADAPPSYGMTKS
ncbi:MAG TPA: GH92 family glycosyl hydrolase [Streptosporangiaceae bacterium]|nr:GH92 family glycosyl hydrolase [Streptosporangiaceae bacterium]